MTFQPGDLILHDSGRYFGLILEIDTSLSPCPLAKVLDLETPGKHRITYWYLSSRFSKVASSPKVCDLSVDDP